jgi:hypothetical protein
MKFKFKDEVIVKDGFYQGLEGEVRAHMKRTEYKNVTTIHDGWFFKRASTKRMRFDVDQYLIGLKKDLFEFKWIDEAYLEYACKCHD